MADQQLLDGVTGLFGALDDALEVLHRFDGVQVGRLGTVVGFLIFEHSKKKHILRLN